MHLLLDRGVIGCTAQKTAVSVKPQEHENVLRMETIRARLMGLAVMIHVSTNLNNVRFKNASLVRILRTIAMA